jgi:hypothetical protein
MNVFTPRIGEGVDGVCARGDRQTLAPPEHESIYVEH